MWLALAFPVFPPFYNKAAAPNAATASAPRPWTISFSAPEEPEAALVAAALAALLAEEATDEAAEPADEVADAAAPVLEEPEAEEEEVLLSQDADSGCVCVCR